MTLVWLVLAGCVKRSGTACPTPVADGDHPLPFFRLDGQIVLVTMAPLSDAETLGECTPQGPPEPLLVAPLAQFAIHQLTDNVESIEIATFDEKTVNLAAKKLRPRRLYVDARRGTSLLVRMSGNVLVRYCAGYDPATGRLEVHVIHDGDL